MLEFSSPTTSLGTGWQNEGRSQAEYHHTYKYVYIFGYIPGSKHRTSGQWFMGTQRSVESDNSSHGNSPKEGRGDSPPTAASAQLPAASVAEASGTQQCTELHEAPFRALLQAGGGASSGGLTLTPR